MTGPHIIRIRNDAPKVLAAPETTPYTAWVVPGKPGPPGGEGDPGDPGGPGRGINEISISGADLVFDMTTGPDETVTVPAILAANNSAAAAAASAVAADNSADAAQASQVAAANSASAAADSAEEAADVVASGIPNATPSIKGGIRLAGDLGGTWDAPTVPGLAGKVDEVSTPGVVYATDWDGDPSPMAYDSGGFGAYSFVQRDAGGVVRAGTPLGSDDATTKGYVDPLLAGKAAASHQHTAADIPGSGGVAGPTTFLRGDNQWIVPTNTTYTALTLPEFTTGTATTARAVSALLLNQEINQKITGASGTAPTSIGQNIAKAADAAAVRALVVDPVKNVANGYAGLDAGGQIPAVLLPSYVDDVLEYANVAAFPVTGETGKLYISQATNRQYRWSGSAYQEINPSPGSSDAVPEGSVNLYYTAARADARAAAALAARTISASTGLTGGGDLSADRSFAVADGGVGTAQLADDAITGAKIADHAIPYDFTLVAAGKDTIRAAGTLDNPFGIRISQACQIWAVQYRCATADASGNLQVELRKNGVAIASTAATIAAASQVAGSTVGSLAVDCVSGDIITVQVTDVGTTPGKGLVADVIARAKGL